MIDALLVNRIPANKFRFARFMEVLLSGNTVQTGG